MGGAGAPSSDAGVDGSGGSSSSAGGATGTGGAGPDAGAASTSQNYILTGTVRRGVMFTEQGEVFDASGVPISGLNLMFMFTLYSASVGGMPLWTESQMITPAKGLFSAQLGSVTPIGTDVLATSPLFLGIHINADVEMSPRQQVTP